MADERILKKMLDMKLRGRRPRGRLRIRWMDQVKRDMENEREEMDAGETRRNGKTGTGGDFFITVDAKNWKRPKKEEEEVTVSQSFHLFIECGPTAEATLMKEELLFSERWSP
jgi:hypothetical protein